MLRTSADPLAPVDPLPPPGAGVDRLRRLARRGRRAVLARRRLLAGLLAGTAVLVGLRAAAPPPAPTADVLVAARDLPAGVRLGPGDVAVAALPEAAVPPGALTAAAAHGRTTTLPLRRGEPVTDLRVLSGSLLDRYPGLVAAPVRVADAAAVALLRVGDRVDLLAAQPRAAPGEARLVASAARVLAVPTGRHGPAGTTGALVVVAVPSATARVLAGAAASSYLSLVLTR